MKNVILALAAVSSAFAAGAHPLEKSEWVWPAILGCPTNTVVEFKRSFSVGRECEARLAISADSVYSVSLNGSVVHSGRFPDVPPMRFYDDLPLGRVRAGANELIISVYAQGVGSFQYLEGNPGLAYALTCGGKSFVSGNGDSWRISSHYRREGVPKITGQLGFSFEYDASAAEWDWVAVVPKDGRAIPVAELPRLRPIARVEAGDALPTRVIGQGRLNAGGVPPQPAPGMDKTVIRPCAKEAFFEPDGRSVRKECLGDGFFVTVDLGREEAGFLLLDADTDKGAVIDIGHAEHIENGRIQTFIGGRNFAGRYRTRAGRQRFYHWIHRMAGRYVQIHVRGVTTHFTLNALTVRPTVFPVAESQPPSGLTPRESEIWRTGVRTLRLCMHEHYEDCPWREQALYGNDSRNQMLAGYFAFAKDSGMPKLAMELLARGIDEKGWVEICMPAKIGLSIPSFTFSWVMAVDDHLKYVRDIGFTRQMMPYLHKVLDRRMAELNGDLLPCPTESRYWQFYDWVKDLSGDLSGSIKGKVGNGSCYESPLNLFAILAFDAGARCAESVGERETAAKWRGAADRMRVAVRAKFWNPTRSQFETRLGGKLAPAELTQALAILANVATPESSAEIAAKLVRGSEWTKTSLSQSYYKYEALMKHGGYDAEVRRDIAETWGKMLDAGATSFWEVIDGWRAFDNAGSLCHGWSAIPLYFYGAYFGRANR